jgi:hypothetical protein
VAAVAISLTFAALLAATDPPLGAGGELVVQVQPWSEELLGMPVFIESAAGSRLTPLDRNGTARLTGLASGDYRITLQRAPATVVCRWSPECAPLHVTEGRVVVAMIYLLKPSSVSSSTLGIRKG